MLTWFGNQKTRTKLMMGSVFTGIVMIGLAALGLTTAMSMRENMDNVNNMQLKPLLILEELRSLQHQSRTWVVQAALTREAADRQQAISKLNEIRDKSEELSKAFEQLIDSPDVQKGYEEFVEARAAYRKVREEELLKLALAGNQDEAIAVMKGDAGRKYKWLLQAIDNLAAIKQKIAQDKYEESVATFMTTRTIMTVSCVVGIVLALLFSWLVSRFLSRNLADLLTAAQALGEGNLDARSHVATRDEVGALAGVFNRMADLMRKGREEQQAMLSQSQAQATEIKGLTEAIGKSQAMIEFNPDGTIITANDNFLTCLGYRLEEIKGQHHRMFCEPSYTSSGDYAAFWQKLNRGEFDAGVYKRIGKGGKEIWIQASYNPIMDANGKVYKVVKFATDVTVQRQAQAAMEQLVAEAQEVLGRLAENDLTREMTGNYSGELEKIKTSINAVVENLTTTIRTVRSAVESVSSGSEEIAKGNEDLSQRTSEQASALEETSASMEEMTSTVKQNADNAKQANQLASTARETADKGGSVTRRAVEAMGEINKSSSKIADIITVIDEIAFQTNLLALNAAVEAARAGEHGRGFAVVAAEVRNLAQRSATAAKEIKGLINESIQRVNDGSELVNQSGKTLEEIVSSVKRVTDIIGEITAASQEQASGIDQVNKAIMSMDETTQQNAALVEETTSAAQSMKEQAKELVRQVNMFKLSDGAGTAPLRRPSVSSVSTAPKVPAKKPTSAKPVARPEPVAAGGSKVQHGADEFEEF